MPTAAPSATVQASARVVRLWADGDATYARGGARLGERRPAQRRARFSRRSAPPLCGGDGPLSASSLLRMGRCEESESDHRGAAIFARAKRRGRSAITSAASSATAVRRVALRAGGTRSLAAAPPRPADRGRVATGLSIVASARHPPRTGGRTGPPRIGAGSCTPSPAAGRPPVGRLRGVGALGEGLCRRARRSMRVSSRRGWCASACVPARASDAFARSLPSTAAAAPTSAASALSPRACSASLSDARVRLGLKCFRVSDPVVRRAHAAVRRWLATTRFQGSGASSGLAGSAAASRSGALPRALVRGRQPHLDKSERACAACRCPLRPSAFGLCLVRPVSARLCA